MSVLERSVCRWREVSVLERGVWTREASVLERHLHIKEASVLERCLY